ncbi:tetratricopeptide repeat protein [Burkholderia sp. LMU1-1-1.1]|uniref:tetratricopeptide repeat protein n=1 Tax=Burkholderia sp. LMU1-1-1.1 TaxID=3135266 RepID=UPI00342A4C92
MSLLMQALKKAERAKQSSAVEDESDRPSEEFDAVLALTPEPAPQAAVPPAKRELSLDLEPMAEFSLEPLAPEAPAASLTPRPSPSPLPPPSDHLDAGLTFDLRPDPSAPVAPTPASAPPQRAQPQAPQPAPASTTSAAAATAAQNNAQNTHGANAGGAAKPTAGAKASAAAKPQAGDKTAGKPRGAARARAAAAATNEPVGMDPERLRLIGLLSILALIVAGFGYYYWQAVVAPGAGSRLPPVPMPPPGATGATPVQVIGAAPGTPAAQNGQPAAGTPGGFVDPMAVDASGSAMLAPSVNRGGRDDLERRLARTEQELAAAQQAIQSQLAGSAPRVERLPPVAAPDNNAEIRVARAVQPAKIAPAVETAYQSFTNGDLPNAQKQYESALRQEPTSRDALLGLAMVHTRQNQGAQAASYYLRMLELDPNDSTAVAGLVGMRSGDTAQSEGRLKAILATNPEAGPALFALGNLYAQQNRWSDAQQTFFRAYSASPDNPDYAYNLAIGLDRLNQGRLALTYYQRALVLSQDKAAAFDRNALRIRMHELGAAQ